MVRIALIGFAILIVLITGYYQVEPDQIGVVQRLGAYVRQAGPGPHFKIPFGVETVTKVPVLRQLKMEYGFRTVRAGTRSEFAATPETVGESMMPRAPRFPPRDPLALNGLDARYAPTLKPPPKFALSSEASYKSDAGADPAPSCNATTANKTFSRVLMSFSRWISRTKP